MEKRMNRIGILTSGGDAPGMNAAIRAAVFAANARGIESIGIRRGYNGLIVNDMIPLTPTDVADISRLGGTMLYTARSQEFMLKKGQKRAADTCRFLGLDGLVIIGGDGSFQGALKLHELGVPVACIPGTIDNDIGCTSYTIGFDTACNTAIEAVDKLNDTMQSHERCSVVEVMGHKTGYIALNVGIATGATVTLIPEVKADFERDVVGKIREARLHGRTHFTVIVAEGACSASETAGKIETATGIETRVTSLGHIQRGGSPLVRDRVAAARMGCRAVQTLAGGEVGRVIVMACETCEAIEITAA
ncbi:MAG: 6-phosphofructokinase, partial [Oscillospiraceae bacterium]|nr:6-phosphofructokinase [Oscillospiraceae bacterium]